LADSDDRAWASEKSTRAAGRTPAAAFSAPC
jgi:hypothetical protein